MAEIYLKKGPAALYPADEEAEEYLHTIKLGDTVRCNMVRPRNYHFHQKYFVLLHLLYDMWEPDEATYKGEIVAKNFERFRADIAILAGFSETPVFDINGGTRLKAKSISFGSMTQDDFEKLYSETINIGLMRMAKSYASAEELDSVVNEILRFT